MRTAPSGEASASAPRNMSASPATLAGVECCMAASAFSKIPTSSGTAESVADADEAETWMEQGGMQRRGRGGVVGCGLHKKFFERSKRFVIQLPPFRYVVNISKGSWCLPKNPVPSLMQKGEMGFLPCALTPDISGPVQSGGDIESPTQCRVARSGGLWAAHCS